MHLTCTTLFLTVADIARAMGIVLNERAVMTNLEAAWVAGLIFTAIAADFVFNGGSASLFLVFKLLDLVDYLKFWE
jgi:hypothetical protein